MEDREEHPMAAKARWYLKRPRFAVLPLHTIDEQSGLCTCGKPDCSSPGKHPLADLVPNGVLNASADLQQITQWWALWPDANIGIATGETSGVIVLDVDAGKGGMDSLTNLEARNGNIPDTWVANTGGGGMHVYFQYVPGIPNRAGIVPGIDVRSDRGYVVAPPSLHKSGLRYEWHDTMKPSASFQRPAVAPEWLIRLMGGSSVAQRARPLPEKITEGGRNDLLTSAAGTMRSRNFSKEAIEAALLIENRMRCQPPLDDQEVKRIAWSIDRYPAAMISTMTIGGKRYG